MNRRLAFALGSLLIVAAASALSEPRLAQQAPPTENKGVVTKPLGVVELGAEIKGMAGRISPK